jgi:predicted GNAT family acetyltransferase
MFVQFPAMRLVEYPDANTFLNQAGPWLSLREAENCYILSDLPRQAALQRQSGARVGRYFTVMDGEQVMAAAVVHASGGVVTTWASPDAVRVLAEQLAAAGCAINTVTAPAHVSAQFARAWARVRDVDWAYGRDERVYQLARVRHAPTGGGALAQAAPVDRALLSDWMAGFVREAGYKNAQPDELLTPLLNENRLFLWRAPEPVAMAAWVAPTPHGGSINFVYVPPEARGRGFGKNVVAALAAKALAEGARYCFILTDTQDRRNNNLYQAVGARTVAELMQCTFTAKNPARGPGGGKLHVAAGGW